MSKEQANGIYIRYISLSLSLSLSTALCFSLCFHDRDKLATLTNDARFRSVVYVPCKLVIHERLLAPSSPPSLFEYVAFKYRGNRGMRRIHPWRILKERKSRRFDENIIKFSRILGKRVEKKISGNANNLWRRFVGRFYLVYTDE